MLAKATFQTGKMRHWPKIISALLAKSTIREASQECGISAVTIHRCFKKPEFMAEYNAAKADLLAAATNRLRTAALGAVETLVEIANAAGASDSARVTAAAKVIELAIKTNTLENIESRLSQLENGASE